MFFIFIRICWPDCSVCLVKRLLSGISTQMECQYWSGVKYLNDFNYYTFIHYREAVELCESDDMCGGFTFKGTNLIDRWKLFTTVVVIFTSLKIVFLGATTFTFSIFWLILNKILTHSNGHFISLWKPFSDFLEHLWAKGHQNLGRYLVKIVKKDVWRLVKNVLPLKEVRIILLIHSSTI